jgi:hypothetical protein
MRGLFRLKLHPKITILVVSTLECKEIMGKSLHQHLEGLFKPLVVLPRITSPHCELLPPAGTASDPELEPTTAKIVGHADLFKQLDRMVKWQHVHQRPEKNTLGMLGDSRQVYCLVRSQAQGRMVVLRDVVAMESSAFGLGD